MKLTEHFAVEEMTFSSTAERNGVANTPGPGAMNNLRRLAENLERVRAVLGKPMWIDSGFRSPELNRLVKGARDSAHLFGRAADFVCPDFGTPLDICRELVRAGVPFDQLIQEGRWVHYSIPVEGGPWRKEILTAHFRGGKVTYTRGLE